MNIKLTPTWTTKQAIEFFEKCNNLSELVYQRFRIEQVQPINFFAKIYYYIMKISFIMANELD